MPDDVNVPTPRPEWWRDGDFCWLGLIRGIVLDDAAEKLAEHLEGLWGPCCAYPTCSGATGFREGIDA